MPRETTPPSLRSLITMPFGSFAPSRANSTRLPGARHVGRAAHDLDCSPSPSNTRDERELVALRVRTLAAHFRHDHAGQLAERFDALDLEPAAVKRADDLVGRRLEARTAH